jgi:hypothetical protein
LEKLKQLADEANDHLMLAAKIVANTVVSARAFEAAGIGKVCDEPRVHSSLHFLVRELG